MISPAKKGCRFNTPRSNLSCKRFRKRFSNFFRDFSRVSDELADEIAREMNEMHFKTSLFQKRHRPGTFEKPCSFARLFNVHRSSGFNSRDGYYERSEYL